MQDRKAVGPECRCSPQGIAGHNDFRGHGIDILVRSSIVDQAYIELVIQGQDTADNLVQMVARAAGALVYGAGEYADKGLSCVLH
jgi:hypothetical protein